MGCRPRLLFLFWQGGTSNIPQNCRSIDPLPKLYCQNFPINILTHYKFLGLTFDHKLTWMLHIKNLKAKCINTINVLKYLSHPRLGCNRKLLLQLYKSLIHSQLDYGAPIYHQAFKNTIKLLDTIQASSLRLSLGAFRTSPDLSLCAEAAEPPLLYRALILTANFLASAAQITELPIHISFYSLSSKSVLPLPQNSSSLSS